MPSRLRPLLLAAAAAALVSGCVVAPYGRDPYRGDEGPVVQIEPPPVRVEVVPVAPGPAYVWIGGHWNWQLNRHVWIGGRWALPPRVGYGWVPGRWAPYRSGGWHWRGGYWGPR